MSTENDLYKLEEKLWTGNADDYRRHVDDECLTVFTEMAGVLDREKIAQSAGDGRKWSGLQMARKGFLEPTDGFAMLSYEATAGRADGTPYKALVSSGYARHGRAWKLAFHQQTPLGSD
jgi:hypothetical protein